MRKETKEKIGKVPEKIREACYLKVGFGTALILAACLAAVCLKNFYLIIPFLFSGIYMIYDALRILTICIYDNYVVIRGKCIEIQQGLFRKNVRAVVIENNDLKVKIICNERRGKYTYGKDLTVYVRQDGKVIQKDGYVYIFEYILIE